MSLEGKSLYILTPMYGGALALNYHNSFVKLVVLCAKHNIPIGWSNTWNESLISRARNRMVDSYLKLDSSTHCLIVDADIGFEAEDVLMMMEQDLDILGVPCTKKSFRWDRIQNAIASRALRWAAENAGTVKPEELFEAYARSGQLFNPPEIPKIGGDFVLNFPPFEGDKIIQLDKPEPMKHVGTGMLMVKRDVFINFKKAYPDRWYEAKYDPASNPGPIHDFFKVGVNPESREYDSEDYWFIHDCIAIGYKVFLHFAIRTTHMGTFEFKADVPAALACAGTIL